MDNGMKFLRTFHNSFFCFDLQNCRFYHCDRREDLVEYALENGRVLLKRNDRLITPINDGAFTLATSWPGYDLKKHDDGAISLGHNGKFLSARPDGSFSFVDKALAWEKFQLASLKDPAQTKIGIFGYYSNDNFGGQLTVLATYSLLKNLGYDPMVFRFGNHNTDPELLYNKICKFTVGSIDSVVSREYWASYFDAFVLCSDWTLHKTWLRPIDVRLFEWTKPEKTRIALGASFGTATGKWEEGDYPRLNRMLARFQHLGVREADGVKFCARVGVPHARQLPDPVFALERNFYEGIAGKQPHSEVREPYVAIYLLDMRPDDIRTAIAICSKLHMEPLFIVAIKDKKAIEKLQKPYIYDIRHGVSSWLYYLLNSSYVITNSFHGLCMALIFGKDFICIPRLSCGGVRERNLLRDLNLMDKLLTRAQDVDKVIEAEISFGDVRDKLADYRRALVNFITNALACHNDLGAPECKSVAALPRPQCTGCLACSHICPRHCISVSRDALTGFAYPSIDISECVHCGMCYKVCPILSPRPLPASAPLRVFCGYSLDMEIRYKSTSGGFFSEIARRCIEEQGAVIFGAMYETPYRVRHGHVVGLEQLNRLRQSKYVQSDLSGIFPEVRTTLEQGKTAVFCGTPCQCAAVASYIAAYKVSPDKLFLIDFICHSVNSPAAYEAYLYEIAAGHKDTIKSVWFKNKEKGWNNFSTRVDFVDSDRYYLADRNTDPFYRGFLQYRLYSRDCCSDCHFKSVSRHADITLADAWGIKIKESDKEGVSAAIIHSEKGWRLFHDLLDRLYTEEKNVEEVSRGNPNLTRSTRAGKFAPVFWERMAKKQPFSQIIQDIEKLAKGDSIKQISVADAKAQSFAIPASVKLNGAIIRAHPTARIAVKESCALYLNYGKLEGSHCDCLVDLKEGATLIVDGNFKIYHSCRIHVQKNAILRLGSGYMNTNGIIVCQKSIDIGDAIIAPNAYIVDSDFHAIIVDGKVINPPAPVKFNGHVWLGQNVTVLKGVTIGEGSVIGAKSLVNRSIPARCLAVGNPARVIRSNVTWR